MVAFQDETGFSLHPRLGRGWAKRGQRLHIATTSQHRLRLNVSGWVAPLSGRYGMVQTHKGDREGFLQVLSHLYRRLQGYTIWLYVEVPLAIRKYRPLSSPLLDGAVHVANPVAAR